MNRRSSLLAVLSLLIVVAPVRAEDGFQFELRTSPGVEAICPDVDLVATEIEVRTGQGEPTAGVFVGLHLHAPEGNSFVSTDFPIVENTHLMEWQRVLEDGVPEGQPRPRLLEVDDGVPALDLERAAGLSLAFHDCGESIRST